MEKLLVTDVIKKLLKESQVRTDHGVFRLHYKLTATFLLGCSLLVTATQFFGEPIYCVTNDVISAAIMNNYCWVEGTFTLPRSINGTLGEDVAAPGVDQQRITENDPVIKHAYYQWVSLLLFFQAAAFYFPRWLWRNWEDGRMKHLINELSRPVIDEKKKNENTQTVIRYFLEHRFDNQKYAFRFFFCEILTLVNVAIQIYVLDRFLGYYFWTYGPSALSFLTEDPEHRVDPMAMVFPKVSKCRMRRFGTSGEVQIHDAICLLSLNIINEKIFVFLWFWFVLLMAATIGSLCFRSVMIGVPRYRERLLSSLAKMVNAQDLQYITRTGNYGDWFLLSILKNNIKAPHFQHVVSELSTALKNPPAKKNDNDDIV